MGIYEDLGVRPLINAEARLTRLGGSLMPDKVLDAMREAGQHYVDMLELQDRVGERIAKLTENEAAYVCNGASAGLFLSAMACMVGDDMRAIAKLPSLAGLKTEIVIHRAHRMPYDPAVELAGAKLVEVGNTVQTFDWEMEAAINENTAAILYVQRLGVPRATTVLSLEETIRIGDANNVPVIVDAANQLPPASNLHRFTRDMGAALAIFSGGKGLRGPQASGLIVGRKDLIAACKQHGPPHQRFARPMKVGKEEMVGLLRAIELFLDEDAAARSKSYEDVVRYWIDEISTAPGVSVTRDWPNESQLDIPRVAINWDPNQIARTSQEVQQELLAGSPAIVVPVHGEHGILASPHTLEPGEERAVAERVVQVLSDARQK